MTPINLKGYTAVNNTQGPKKTVSNKYGFVSTLAIADRLGKMGWMPVEAQISKVVAPANYGYQKHLVKFRHPDVVIPSLNGEILIPELIFVNGHTGAVGIKFALGVFRTYCLNGLISGFSIGNFNMVHTAGVLNKLGQVIDTVVETIPTIVNGIDAMRTINMTEEQRFRYAAKAVELKYGQEGFHTDPETGACSSRVPIRSLVEPVRAADKGDSVWSLYNTVQEKLVEGRRLAQFISYKEDGSVQRKNYIKGVVSVAERVRLNQGLWNLAIETVK